jgi:hypothetical protein
MHAKYRLKKNFLAQPETNFSSMWRSLHVSVSTADSHWRHPAGVEHHHMQVRLRFCRVGER